MPATDLHKRTSDLAINGGPNAFATMSGRRAPKIGIEGVLSIAERFGFSPQALERIRSAVSEEDLGAGPTLSRFMTALPPVAKGDALEKLAREILGVQYAHGGQLRHRRAACRDGGRGRRAGDRSDRACDRVLCHGRGGRACPRECPSSATWTNSLGMDPKRSSDRLRRSTVAIAPDLRDGGVL